MAMIDYGAILTRDGFLVSTERFMESTDMGFKDDFTEDYFVCAGDEKFTIGFYKMYATVRFVDEQISFMCGSWFDNKAQALKTTTTECQYILNMYDDGVKEDSYVSENVLNSGVSITFERIDKDSKNNKFKATFTYKDHNYVAYFGYGIDNDVEVFECLVNDSNRPYGYTNTVIEVLREVYKLPSIGGQNYDH